jgi:hypothetical protein
VPKLFVGLVKKWQWKSLKNNACVWNFAANLVQILQGYFIGTCSLSLETSSCLPLQGTSHPWTPKFHNLFHQLAAKLFEIHILLTRCMPRPTHSHRLNQFTTDNLYDITEDQSWPSKKVVLNILLQVSREISIISIACDYKVLVQVAAPTPWLHPRASLHLHNATNQMYHRDVLPRGVHLLTFIIPDKITDCSANRMLPVL